MANCFLQHFRGDIQNLITSYTWRNLYVS